VTDSSNDDGLVRQLLKQAETIARLRRELEDLTTETNETVANLLARIEALEDDSSDDIGLPLAPTSWCWRTIGPHGAETLWRELRGWVAWIRHRYPLARRIPECWPEHPEIVEELTALWLAWQAAYAVADAPLMAAIEWHDRWLPGVLHRLERGPFALDCGAGHAARPPALYAPSDAGSSSEWDTDTR